MYVKSSTLSLFCHFSKGDAYGHVPSESLFGPGIRASWDSRPLYGILLRLCNTDVLDDLLITISIAATRMYRSLVDFGNPTEICAILHFHHVSALAQCDRCHRSAMNSKPRAHKIRHGWANSTFGSTYTVAMSPERVEMAVHTVTSHEGY